MKPGAERREYLGRLAGIVLVLIVTAGLGVGLASMGTDTGIYGLALFIAVPFFLGFFPVAMLRPFGARGFWYCLALGSTPLLLFGFFMLFLGKEGLVCLVMAVPLGGPVSALGAATAYWMLHHRPRMRGPTAGLTCLALTAGSLLIEERIPLGAPVYTVEDAVEIAASPEVVWSGIIAMDSLPPPDAWIFRTGVACPVRTEIEGAHVGGTRRCTLTTGPLLERITRWEPARHLGWEGVHTPPPLREINPFRSTDPPHLHGYYKSRTGEFQLEEIAAGRTRVVRRSSYEHNLQPAWYWRLWCDYAAHQGHRYVLDFLARSVQTPQR